MTILKTINDYFDQQIQKRQEYIDYHLDRIQKNPGWQGVDHHTDLAAMYERDQTVFNDLRNELIKLLDEEVPHDNLTH